MKSTICVAEDRRACEPSLKLLLLSLSKHWPESTISLFYPAAENRFLDWVKKCSQVCLQPQSLAQGLGWNVKPQAILRMIDQGFDEVIWIDSDILVTRDPRHLFASLQAETFVATEDALGDERDDRDALRARLWGFPVGRVLPFGLNTGVLRVTSHHYSLVERWWSLLQSDKYQDVQKMAWDERPIHMLGDQDVLTALLSSQEFSKIPLHILRRGKDILQFNGVYGYTVVERMGQLFGDRPAFIHQFGHKPWSDHWRPSADLRDYAKKVYLDQSPYTLSALQFRSELECDTEWMEPHYLLSRILRALGMGCPELAGLPVAAVMELARVVKYMRKPGRLKLSRLEPAAREAAYKR